MPNEGDVFRIGKAQELEALLSPEKLEVWRVVSQKLPTATDYGLELYLLKAILGGASVEDLLKFIPRRSGQERRQHLDRRELQAGER